MPVSLDSQIKVLERIKLLRPADLVRAGLAQRSAEAELLHQYLSAAVSTFRFVAGDERIRRLLEMYGPKP